MGAPWNVLEVCERDGDGSSEVSVTSEEYIMPLGIREDFVGCGGVVDGRLEYSLWSIRRALRDKRPGRNIITLHDNAHPHAALLTSEAIAKRGGKFFHSLPINLN